MKSGISGVLMTLHVRRNHERVIALPILREGARWIGWRRLMDEFARWKAEQAAAWLDHVRGLALSVEGMRDRVELLRSLALPAGIDYSKPVVSTSPSADQIPNAVIKLQEAIADYCTELSAYVDESRDAKLRLASIGDWRYREAVTRYYVDGMSWREVGDRMGYVPDWCRQLRDEALPIVYDVMPNEWRVMVPRAD